MSMQYGGAAWDTSLPDWEERIAAGRSLVPTLPLFDAQAEKALKIFKRLRVPDLFGKPTYGEVCDAWVFDIVRTIFGAYDVETKCRALQEIFLLIPKKNGKSSIAAAIIVTAALMNERPEAELLLIAPTMTIANIAFKQASGIIEADDTLRKLFHIREHLRSIKLRETPGTVPSEIMIKAADGDVITGGKATYTLIDETHEFAKKSRAAGVFVELRGALASRPDGFLMQITTQSKEAPAGVFKEELDQARAVRDGRIKLPILAVLYELPPKLVKRWQDPETWPMVNPNFGRSVNPEFLRNQLISAKEKGPAALQLLASQHFNVEISVGFGGRWRGAELWEKSIEPCLTLDELIARCEVATIGLDGGGLDDLFGLGVVGRDRQTKDWLGWGRAWAHPEVLIARKEIASRLQDFERAGELVLLSEEEPTGEIDQMVEIVVQLMDAGLLPDSDAIGLDTVQVTAIGDALLAAGVAEEMVCYVGQDWRLSPAIWGIERRMKNGTFRHADQAMMNWCLGNAKVEQKGSAVRMTKEAAGRAKIDPLVALLNAFTLMSRNPVAAGPASISIPDNYTVA